METDPFDAESEILPFCAELWDGEISQVIWEETYEKFVEKTLALLLALPSDKKWIVYAHNGGKFDFMFLVHKLRGQVSFKGRGIMLAHIAPHVEIRDSMHIIPDKLASYKKQAFDYKKLKKNVRHKHRPEILDYLHSDCVNLHEIVTHFIEKHGAKLSIGQAAWSCLKKDYGIETFSEASDTYIRQWYFGGRVECLQGPGHFQGDYVLEDVNSMYPDRMAHCEHPIGAEFMVRGKGKPPIRQNTVFLEVQCTNFGALIGRDENGQLTPNIKRGIFKTTIWEFEAAERLGLIRDITIKTCVDFHRRSNFAKFVIPRYTERQKIKDRLDTEESLELERDALILKLEMNNAYGKGAQNPRKFREFFYTDLNEHPPGEHCGLLQYRDKDDGIWKLHLEADDFLVWEKPTQQRRYNNVAMAASITGAARAKLLERLASAEDAIYCDTDSIICKRTGTPSSNALGAWKIEKSIDEALIGGKKLYGYRGPKGETIRSKGGSGLEWHELAAIVAGAEIKKGNNAPKFDKVGFQDYVSRTFKLTCPRGYHSRIFDA